MSLAITEAARDVICSMDHNQERDPHRSLVLSPTARPSLDGDLTETFTLKENSGVPPNGLDRSVILAAIEASGEAVLITSAGIDRPGPYIEYVNPAFTQMTGYELQEVIGQTPRIFQGFGTERDTLDRMRATLASGETFQGEAVNYRKDGSSYMVEWLITPVRDTDGHIAHWVSAQRDVTARHEAEAALRESEARQTVMVAELQHRTRNLIAVVRSIADDTMNHTGPTEAFRDAFSDRLSALSRVQGLLSRSEVDPITIGALVQLEFDALGMSALGERVTVSGPAVFLRSSTVQTLAMALHELATNARKYGALSHDRGHLAVAWRERVEGGETRLALDWIETGLEQAIDRPAPAHEAGGYGRELIEEALPHALGARTTYALSETGVSCRIDIAARPGLKAGHPHGARPSSVAGGSTR